MSGYLSRVAARNAEGGLVTRTARPFVRSGSPIADLDQRIGMTDLTIHVGDVSGALPGSPATVEKHRSRDPDKPRSLLHSAESVEHAATPIPPRYEGARSPEPLPPLGGQHSSSARQGSEASDLAAAMRPHSPTPSRSDGSPALAFREDDGVLIGRGVTRLPESNKLHGSPTADGTGFENPLAGHDAPSFPSSATIEQVDAPGQVGARSRKQPRLTSRRTDYGFDIDDLLHARQHSTTERSSESTVPRPDEPVVTPSRQATLTARATDEPEMAVGMSPRGRVEIGEILVEVIPPPVSRPPTAGAPTTGPITAASVSRIGPLTGASDQSRRF